MPIHHEFAPGGTHVIIHLSGRVTPEDVLGDVDAVASHPSYRPGLPELVSLETAQQIDLDFRTLLGVSSRMQTLYSQYAPRTPMAIYAPGDVAFGVARMFQAASAMGRAIEVEVFRDKQEALGWLFGPPHCRKRVLPPGAQLTSP